MHNAPFSTLQNVTGKDLKDPVKITKIIEDVDNIVKIADSKATPMIAEVVTDLMGTLAAVVPTPNDTTEEKNNYRQVSLTSLK